MHIIFIFEEYITEYVWLERVLVTFVTNRYITFVVDISLISRERLYIGYRLIYEGINNLILHNKFKLLLKSFSAHG